MQRSILIWTTTLLLSLFLGAVTYAQENGQDDLDAAFDRKADASTLGDFEAVVKLCKSAMKKGLDAAGESEAKSLASAALFEHVEQLMIRLRNAPNPSFYRREALKKLDEALEFNDEMGEAWLMMARLNMTRGGDIAKARSSVDRAIGLLDELPKQASEAYRLRAILVSTEDKEAGMEDLDKAVELDNTNLLALQTRSSVLFAAGETDRGLEDVERMAELNEGKVDAILGLGTMLSGIAVSKTRAADAVENADDSDNDTDNDEPAKSKEEVEAEANKIRESALGLFAKVIELAPEKTQAYVLKAAIHQELKQQEEAMSTIDALIERDGKSVDALLAKARLLISDRSNDDQVGEILDKAININPYSEPARRLRMVFFASRERMPEAIAEAEKVIEKNPNDTDTMAQLALYYSINDEPEKAIEIQSNLLQYLPASQFQRIPPRARPSAMMMKIDLLRSRGDSYLSTGEHEKAIEDYEEAISLSDQIEEMQASLADIGIEYTPSDGVLNNLAWVLATSTFEELRDGERAIELATQACDVTDYKAPHILSTLAAGYAETGDFDKAIEWIEKGLKLNEERELTEIVTEEEKARQKASLEKELEFYKAKKPWRENQAEEDAAKEAEAKIKKNADTNTQKSDDDESDDDESDEEEDK